MKLLLFGLGFGLQFVLCHSQVCIPTWTQYPRSYSIGGSSEPSARQLQDCLARCERRSTCLAVDFNTNLDVYCWLYFNPNDLGGSSFKENVMDNAAQYRISRNCTDYGKGPECPPEWVHNRSIGSYYGEQVNYWTEYDCFTFCRYSNSCVAVDYNNKTKPPCWIHKKDSSPINVSVSEGVVQYRLNKTCPSLDNSTRLRIGRCVGQYFPTAGWCPPGARIHINDSWFRVNPLCCYRNAEDAYPPDSLSLASFRLGQFYLDPVYFNEINSSCDGQSTCKSAIRAKSNSAVEEGLRCPDGEIGTNYVSIVYQCISDGSMPSEDMTTKTTGATAVTPVAGTTIPGTTIPGTTIPGTTIPGTTIPGTIAAGMATPGTATAGSTALTTTTKTTPSDIEKAASNDATAKENRDRLIIGLCVGLGVPLILIIIIVVVVLVRRRKRQWKQEPKESYPVDNYYYNSETAPRGVIPENEHNEISMAVDAF